MEPILIPFSDINYQQKKKNKFIVASTSMTAKYLQKSIFF